MNNFMTAKISNKRKPKVSGFFFDRDPLRFKN